jgi:hypothetical protein
MLARVQIVEAWTATACDRVRPENGSQQASSPLQLRSRAPAARRSNLRPEEVSIAKGVILVLLLNALALGAALALGVRLRTNGRAELGVAVTMLWNALVMCPVYVLGLTNHLYPRTLAWTSAAFFASVYLVARGPDRRALERELWRALWGLVRLPFSALREAARARSMVLLAVVFTGAMLAWTFFCAYLTPSWRGWDALWYHEPIVGFSIQNHGFRIVDLQLTNAGAQKINAYPRLVEMTQLWFVIFTDRRSIDMVGHLAAPALALAVYAMARRHTHRVVAMALGCTVLLMPACAMMLGSTYVDEHNAAFVVAGACFATRPTLRLRDALMAAVCLALAVGSKQMALVPAGVLSLITATRVILRARGRWLPSTATILGGAVLIGAVAAVTYVRNWIHFGNPFWPDLKYDNARLGIHWPGAFEWKAGEYEAGVNRLDMNLPVSEFLTDLYRIPYSVPRGYYTQTYEYGLGTAWVVLPIAFVATCVLAFTPLLDLLGLALRRQSLRPAPETRNATLVALTLVPMCYFTPALWGARYQIAAVGLALVLVAWLAGRTGLEHLGDNVAGALSVMAIISFFWTTPRWWLTWGEAIKLASVPWPEREFTPASALSLELDPRAASPITKDVGLAREKQLGPGALLVFDEGYSAYMALFWNNEFSNQIMWVHEGPDFLERVRHTDATWLYCANSDPHLGELRRADSGWKEIGTLQVEHYGSVFRRTQW